MKDPYLQRADEVFAIEMEALEAVRQSLGSSFGQVVASLVGILNQRGKIVVVGVGKSGNIGRKIAATLTSTGAQVSCLTAWMRCTVIWVWSAKVMRCFSLSYSGETSELIDLIPALRRLKVHLIGMCGAVKSTVAKACDHLLQVTIPREACPSIWRLPPAPQRCWSWAMPWPWPFWKPGAFARRTLPRDIQQGRLVEPCCFGSVMS